MELFFKIVIFLNIPLAVVAFYYSYFILKRSKESSVYFNFGLSVLFLGLWMSITLLDYFRFSIFLSVTHAKLAFFVSIWILYYFFLFTCYFPFPKEISRRKNIFLFVLTLIISLSSFIGGLYVIEGHVDFPFRYRVMNPIGLSVFILYFFILSVLSFNNLLNSLKNSDELYRSKIKKIFFGTGIAIIANLVLSLINFYYSIFDLTVIGMFFVFGVLIYIYIILFSKKV